MPEFSHCERVLVDKVTPALVDRLYLAWLQRRPLVLELALEDLRQPERETSQPWQLKPQFTFLREQLQFLVWANNYDGTKGDPIWWHGRLARRLGNPEFEVDGGPRCDLPFPVIHRETVELSKLTPTHPLDQTPAQLAPDQRQAVLHRGAAACVLAPAGSGKTRVLTERLRHLLACGIEPERITALAYNRRAALEMRSRLPEASHCVRTLHALGYGLLRRHRGLELASEREVRSLLSRLIKPPALLNQDPLQPYLDALQRIRLGLMDPEEVEEDNPDELPGLATAFPRYREMLAEKNRVDHDEQIYGAIELLLQEPEIRKQAQRAATHLLVDEFQDLTPAFVLLVRLLSAPAHQVFGVGDDDQVIYGYAGASPEYLVHFPRFFAGAERHQLEVNYRCPPGIVAAATHLLRRNKLRIDKDTRAVDTRQNGAPELILSPPAQAARQAVDRVAAWNSPSKVAVLARVNALLMPIQVLLGESGIPHSPAVDATVLQRTGLRTALAYLRLAQNRFTPADLADALRRPNRKLKREIIEKMSGCTSSSQLMQRASQHEGWVYQQLDEFCITLARLKGRLQRQGLPGFFAALRQESGFLEAVDQLDKSGLGASGGSSHRDDLVGLEQTAHAYQGDLAGFEPWLESHLNAAPHEEGVRLSSVHRVKGQEWPYVLVYGVDQGMMPHRLSEDLEEERRILHVAITRAQEHCVLVADPDRLSPFVKELSQPPTPPPKQKKKKKKSR